MLNLLPLLLLLTGCSSLSDATIPAQESSVTYAPPDTIVLQDVPPVRFTGEETEAVEVHVYEDTASGPASVVEGIAVDRTQKSVTVRSRSGDSTIAEVFRLPEYGEVLQLRSDSVGFDARVAGAPTQESARVMTSSINKPWHDDLMGWMWIAGALVGGAVVVLLLILRGLP